MKTLISALWLASSLAAGTAWAQPYTPNDMGVTMGHWHLNSNDVEASKKIFAGMGGTALKAGDFDVVRFPGVVVMLHLRPGGPPSAGLLPLLTVATARLLGKYGIGPGAPTGPR